jgi:predicted nucleic acid-binding Zn ribbon protein
MPAKAKKKKPVRASSDQRKVRTQQVIFIVISIFIILAMLLSFLITL